MADQHNVAQVELVEYRGEVVCVGIHVVAGPGLSRPAVAAPVVGNRAVAMRRHERQLVIPGVGIERPAMAEDDGLPRPPILIEESGRLHVLPGRGSNIAHRRLLPQALCPGASRDVRQRSSAISLAVFS